jgi:hypothetical protein
MRLDAQSNAAWAIIRALRSGEVSFARMARRYLADGVTFASARERFDGVVDVTERLTGQWTYTPVLAAGAWDVLPGDDGKVHAVADFTGIGAAPIDYRLEFDFDAEDRITAIRETSRAAIPVPGARGMSPWLRRSIDRALAEGKPITLSYVDASGSPSLSLRGSLYTIDDRRLGLWIRKQKGGLADAIDAGQIIALLYRDSATRTTLIGKLQGRIITNPKERQTIFEMTPEVEQRHDPRQIGAAAILALIELKGTSPRGPILVQPVKDVRDNDE